MADYERRRSSAAQRDDHDDDDCQERVSNIAKSSPLEGGGGKGNFRRWSRNLSASRQRELDRLNQIEKVRQNLELKRQNELLNQMSFTVNNLNLGSTQTPEHELSEQPAALAAESANCAQNQQVEPTPIAGGGGSSGGDSASEQHDRGIANGDGPQLASTCGLGATGASAPPEGQQELRLIHTSQLVEFVCTPVPKHKRLLCLIIRDKMSKLNQTKSSYFYPVYYLFLQAIVDSSGATVEREPSNGAGAGGGGGAEAEEAADLLQERPDSELDEDNNLTFSASSSLSADMLFIGTNASGANAAAANANSGAGQAGAAQSFKVANSAATSYSDNENCAADDELISAASQTTPDLVPGARLQSRARAAKLNSLVFPKPKATAAGTKTESRWGRSYKRRARKLAKDCPESSDEEEDEEEEDEGGEEGEWGAEKKEATGGVADGERRRGGAQVTSEQRTSGGESGAGKFANLFDNYQNPFTGTYGVLLSGRKRRKTKTYLIGPSENGSKRKNCICKLKSNVLGTQFNAIRLSPAGNNDRCTIASISYETNVLGFKGPRKMRALLAKEPTGQRQVQRRQHQQAKSLAELFKRDPSSVIQLKNMTPSWNVESQSYVLNFHGRVTQASVKNFQLIECEDHLSESQRALSQQQQQLHLDNNKHFTTTTADRQQLATEDPGGKANSSTLKQQHKWTASQIPSGGGGNNSNNTDVTVTVASTNTKDNNPPDHQSDHLSSSVGFDYNESVVMQFGRISSNEFTCDVTHPLSILQAFAIALSSFDSKLACE